MDKTEIVRTFLQSGYQISGDALIYFEENPDKVRTFLDLSGGRLEKPIVTRQTIDNILSGVKSEISVKIFRSFAKKPKQQSVEDVTNIFMKKYEKLSEILAEKKELVNLISINRISQQTQKFSIIATVKEINAEDRSLVVEDPTGSTQVFISDEALGELNYLVEDEIVGLICDNEESSENRTIKIIFPDIPLQTKVASSEQDINCLFVSDIHMDDPKFLEHNLEKFREYLKKIKQQTIVFVLGDISKKKADINKFEKIFPENFSIFYLRGELKKDNKKNWLPDPTVVDVGGVKIFLSHGNKFLNYYQKFKTSPENMLLQLLKKRHLFPTFKQDLDLDYEKLFLDEVPDIFVIGHYHEPKILNYKGITLISLGSFVTQPIFWAVNLKTRENIKIDLT